MNVEHNIKEAINLIRISLQNLYPEAEIQTFIWFIFEKYFQIEKVKLHVIQDKTISNEEWVLIEEIISRLQKYEPIQYILEEAFFYDTVFYVNSNVLIPRPETEELVHWIISDFPNFNGNLIDLGTGSGCIPISLKKKLPKADVYAIDIAEEALQVAIRNAKENLLNIHFKQMDLLENQELEVKFDIIVSNPPYIRESEKKLMQENVLAYEPHSALFVPDNKALVFYDAIASFALNNLKEDGYLYLEINEALSYETAVLLESRNFVEIEIRKDIHSKNRMIKAKLGSIL